MKRILIALSLIFIFQIQHTTAQEYNVGILIGGQITKLTGDDLEDVNIDSRVGMLGGFYVNRTYDKLVIQTEVLYSVKGVTFEDLNERVRLTYIDIPIIAKYHVLENLNIHLGPQIGLLIHPGFEDVEVSEQFKAGDIGISAGLEFVSSQKFAVGARYNYGLLEIGDDFEFRERKNDVIVGNMASKFSNRSIQVYLTFDITGTRDKGTRDRATSK